MDSMFTAPRYAVVRQCLRAANQGRVSRMILLIRHGETALNAARVVQPEDTPLSERGIAQAARLAQSLAKLGVAHVLSSDLPRARATADALVRSTGAAIEDSVLLQERNFGDIRGRA